MFPKEVSKFIPWTKAMVQGAIVGKPNYGKGSGMTTKARKRKKRKKRKRSSRNAEK